YCHTVVATRERGLRVCTHLIVGLPGEGREMMLETLARVREVGMDGIKLHPLHVVRHTMLAHEWRKGGIDLLTQPEYVSLVCDMLERMPANWVIHRLTGTASEDLLLAPGWCTRKWAVINDIYAEMHRRGSSQGSAIEDSGQIPLAYDLGKHLHRAACC
ncbi:MAG: TIGR01212 family radical SAM protein, partial [Mariprofundaceae bacterium]|nr:TIGR01212 family radical SAM protein [Mariprofundaceae bacterium]